MAKLIAHDPPKATLKSSGYMGQPTGTVEITENGTYNVKPYAYADVQVPDPPLMKKVITKNGDYVAADDGVYGYSEAEVNLPFEQKTVTPSTQQQIVTVTPNTEYQALEQVTVKATPLENITITPKSTQETYTPTAPAIGFSEVTVEKYIPPLEKDVNFYDYDGTLLYSYTAQEALALITLPNTVTHDYLLTDGWNYTLAEIQTDVRNGFDVDVGAQYKTLGGKTRIYLSNVENEDLSGWSFNIRIRTGTVILSVNDNVLTSAANTGTFVESYTLNFNLPSSNTYPADYIIELSFEGNGYYVLGQGILATSFLRANTSKMAKVKRVDIGDNCIINSNAFQHCLFEKIVISTGFIENIGTYAFEGCNNLKCVIIPKGVITIGQNSFYGCRQNKKIVLPPTVTTLGTSAFNSNVSLNSFIIPNSVISVGQNVLQACYALVKVGFSSNITSTPTNMLSNCSSLSNIVFPNNITTIGEFNFTNDNSITNIFFPNSVKTLSDYCVYTCVNLYKAVLSKSIMVIGSHAFAGCAALQYVDLSDYDDPLEIPALENSNAFESTANFYFLNQEMLDAFASATNWSTYASRFQIKGVM